MEKSIKVIVKYLINSYCLFVYTLVFLCVATYIRVLFCLKALQEQEEKFKQDISEMKNYLKKLKGIKLVDGTSKSGNVMLWNTNLAQFRYVCDDNWDKYILFFN